MSNLESSIPAAFDEDIQAFIASLELERGLSPNTTQAYLKDLSQCAQFLVSVGVKSWRTVASESISLWISSLNLEDYSVASLARKLSAVRMLARFSVREGLREDDFAELISSPKMTRRIPGVLTPKEVDGLLAAPDLSTPHGLRDKAILELMYSSGLRVTELCDLSLQSIDIESGFLRVMGKGGKERGVPVGGKALKALESYLALGRPALLKPHTGSELFISQRGRLMSRKTIWHWIKVYAERAGITKNVKPHLLRHSFATHLLAGGANLRIIQEMLGHADIVTTEIYTSVDASQLIDAHSKHHPRCLVDSEECTRDYNKPNYNGQKHEP